MQLPEGYTEQDLVEIINKCVTVFTNKYKIPIKDIEDIKQQGCLFGLEALPKYTPGKKLDAFLYIHIRNRLLNHIRHDNTNKNIPNNKAIQLNIDLEQDSCPAQLTSNSEWSQYIKDNIPLCFRADYLRMIDNAPISHIRKQRIREIVIEILRKKIDE